MSNIQQPVLLTPITTTATSAPTMTMTPTVGSTTTPSVGGVNQQQQQQQPLSQQQLVKVYTGLLLRHLQAIGFDAQAVGEKNNIVFNQVMFIKPNSKAFELILQFLFTQLDAERASRVLVPLGKEAMKEFKDAIFNWLNELATGSTSSGGSSTSSAGGGSKSGGVVSQTGGGGGGGKSGQQAGASPSTNPAFSRLYQYIRFPSVSRSTLTVPCGIKACEILYALLTHLVLNKTTRLSKNL